MDFRPLIKEIGRGTQGARELPEPETEALFGAMLDGAVPDLELGAILMAYRIKGETVGELRAFARALAIRSERIDPPASSEGARPVLLPSYNGARKLPNLTPLVAHLLARRGVPVLVHGNGAAFGRVTTEEILRHTGVEPVRSRQALAGQWERALPAYAPLDWLSPGLARLLAVRERMGLRSSGHTVAKLLDPFAGKAVLVIPLTHPDYLALMRDYLNAAGPSLGGALLFRGHEGEPCAGPSRPLDVEVFARGRCHSLHAERPLEVPLPDGVSVAETAAWTKKALAGVAAIPATVLAFVTWCEAVSRSRLNDLS